MGTKRSCLGKFCLIDLMQYFYSSFFFYGYILISFNRYIVLTFLIVRPKGTTSYDGLIYCCGGYDGASCLSSVERFDPLTGVWTSCPAMSTRRRYCRSVIMGNIKRCNKWTKSKEIINICSLQTRTIYLFL